jgi:hypothetical protein
MNDVLLSTATNWLRKFLGSNPSTQFYFIFLRTRMVSSYRNTPDFLPKFLGVGSHLDEPVLVYAGELTPARHYVQSSRTTKVELVVQWH